MDDEVKSRVLSEFMRSQEGRQRLAEAMIKPIRQRLYDPWPYRCFVCGTASDDKDYVHTADECAVAQVMNS